MIHVRIDDEELNANARFGCGIVGTANLPKGDVYYFQIEAGADRSDCPGCNPAGPRQYGTPISHLSGRPGQPGYDEFCRIARSWGYE